MTVTSGVHLRLQNFVGDERLDASDGRTIDVVDPSTGAVYATSPCSSAEDVDATGCL